MENRKAITDYQKKVLDAEICPYCKSETKIVDEMFVYGQIYKGRNIICCSKFPDCDSFVGCHKDGTPLGRLADKELRKAKIDAHKHFDKIWQENLMERGELYKSLSGFLKIHADFTHIGMFQKHTCEKVSEWAKQKYQQLKNK